MFTSHFLVISALLICFVNADEEVVRNTTYGQVKGLLRNTNNSVSIERFAGIPYAAPPLQSLRFRPPEKHSGWTDLNGPLDATNFRAFCPQISSTTGAIIGDEDCLHLNLYVPRKNNSDPGDLLAVFFWIHGGGYSWGYSDFYDSELAWHADVIVVTFNYRLGPLGFLSTGDNKSPGNYGVMDQIAALQWVKENIHNFGGDKNRITVAGESAGGSVAQLLALSTEIDSGTNDQLFHRVISQSGSAFSDFAFDNAPYATARSFFEDCSCPIQSNAIAMACIQEKTVEEIVTVGWKYNWDVVVDGELFTDTPQKLVEDPENLIRLKGRYQYLSGVNTFDSIASYESIDGITDAESFMDFMESYLKTYFNDSQKIADAVFMNYINWDEDLPSDLDSWKHLAINATRDMHILAPSLKFSSLASASIGFNSDAYHYLFGLRPSVAIANTRWAYPPNQQYDWVSGNRHAEVLPYVFGVPITTEGATDEEKEISLQMMRYWGNFVRTGDPSIGLETDIHWPKYDDTDSNFLIFGVNTETSTNIAGVGHHLETDKVVFWSQEIPLYAEGDGTDDKMKSLTVKNETILPEPIVNTTSGQIRGLRLHRDEYIMDRFFRIPFAKAPEGELRFEPPQPRPAWEGILDCSDRSSAKQWLYICPQRNIRGNGNFGREDCLNMNIWVPGGVDAKKNPPLPVMVWIYGGGNQIGTNIGFTFYYDMERLAAQGTVIGVTLNYRLNSLGFLSMDDDVVPGNMGLLDQRAALQWVQDNIARFGGDPNKVTIFGQSAGGGSVSFHMISPMSQNLFLRGISQSGCLPSTWTYSSEGRPAAEALARELDCPTTTSQVLVQCLRTKPLKQLISAGIGKFWGPVVDGKFLPMDPLYAVNASVNKDYMIGHNSMEGHGTMSAYFPILNLGPDRVGSAMDRDDVRKASKIYDINVPEYVSEAVAYKYIDWDEPESAYLWPRLAITDIGTDWTFAMGTFTNAEIRAEENGLGRTFVYVFGEKSRVRLFPDWVESNHLRELVYTFGHPFEETNIAGRFTDTDRELSRAMMTYWTNFAWSGDPNYPNSADIPTSWPDYTKDTKISMLFNTSMYENPSKYVRSNYRGDRYHMWREILYNMNALPLETCAAVYSDVKDSKANREVTEVRQNKDVKSLAKVVDCPDSHLVRKTLTGCIEGVEYDVDGSKVERYLGIPYAAPPLGTLRFAKPESKNSWNGTLLTTQFSKICPQAPFINTLMDEDCLYLSVYVPSKNNSVQPLAVMVWLHGGGNQVGDGMSSYQGDALATYGDIIVVTVNYRLGSLGFLTTDDNASYGNYGLFDQHLAIQWVKNNIAFFGGDPARITIAGQSAGAEDALYHTFSPLTEGLGISRVIAESSARIPSDDMKQLESAITLGQEASCDTTSGTTALVECLRALDIDQLISAQARTFIGFYPTVDGVFLPDHPKILSSDGTRAKQWTHLIGANDGDGSVGWNVIRDVTDEPGYHEAITNRFESMYNWRTSSIDEHYAHYQDLEFFQDEQKIQKSLIQSFGDEMFIFPMHKLAIDYSGLGSDVYFYYFTYAAPSEGVAAPPEWIGARHSSEIPLIFGTVLADPLQDTAVQNLSRGVIEYWSNFVKTGIPSNADAEFATTTWPVYKDRRSEGHYLELNLGSLTAAKMNLRPTDDAFWNDYMLRQSVFCEVDPGEMSTNGVTQPNSPDLDTPMVMVEQGYIEGMRVTTELFDVHAFLGIPYAEPPIGNLRFEKPTKFSAGAKSIPILIWIHGDSEGEVDHISGSFWTGGGSPGWNEDGHERIDPSYLASSGNLLIIRPNFRLGAFGFLTTGDDVLEGNYGLWDLQAVVEWAANYGEAFGGDPNNIAVMGQGSGAALAELLGVLPKSSQYVKRVISQSGSMFSPWAFCTDYSICDASAQKVASSVGCEYRSENMVSCLKAATASDIANSVPYFTTEISGDIGQYNGWGTWRLRKDGNLVPKSGVDSLFAESNFDFMSGTTSHEFYRHLKASNGMSASLNEMINDTDHYLADAQTEQWPQEMIDVLSHSYTPWSDPQNPDLVSESIVKYYTDFMFQAGSSRDLQEKQNSNNGSIYQYVLTRKLNSSIDEQTPLWLGGSHGDDVIYLFGIPLTSSAVFSEAEKMFSLKMMSHWSNFIWNGNPNTALSSKEWLEYKTGEYYLSLDDSNRRNILTQKTSNYNIEKSALWNEIIPLFSPENGMDEGASYTREKERPFDIEEDICTEEIPPIGTGIGLNLTPESADTAIYTLFSICLILGFILIFLLVKSCIQAKKRREKEFSTFSTNPAYVNHYQ